MIVPAFSTVTTDSGADSETTFEVAVDPVRIDGSVPASVVAYQPIATSATPPRTRPAIRPTSTTDLGAPDSVLGAESGVDLASCRSPFSGWRRPRRWRRRRWQRG
jgi:hypothetical protein